MFNADGAAVIITDGTDIDGLPVSFGLLCFSEGIFICFGGGDFFSFGRVSLVAPLDQGIPFEHFLDALTQEGPVLFFDIEVSTEIEEGFLCDFFPFPVVFDQEMGDGFGPVSFGSCLCHSYKHGVHFRIIFGDIKGLN